MAETFEEYTARIQSYVAGKNPLALLRRTPATLRRELASAGLRRLTARPKPGKWSVGEIWRTSRSWRCSGGSGSGSSSVGPASRSSAWTSECRAKNSRYRSIDPRRALQAFLAIRAANLDLLGRLSPRERKRWGAHSQFGRLTIDRIVQLVAGHDVNHLRQIRAVLARRPRHASGLSRARLPVP